MTVEELMKEKGFTFADTGGGFTSYSRPARSPELEGAFVLVTDIYGEHAPEDLDQEVLVGVYDGCGEPIGDVERFATLREYLEVIG